VLAEARRIADLGYTEIQLLGQNVNSYRDPEGKRSFAELLAAVGEVPSGIRRVRFTTSHPRDFTRDIVEAIDAVPTLCDHVHLPVQSGSSRILKAMNREYTREWYLERIAGSRPRAGPSRFRPTSLSDFPAKPGRLHPDHGPSGRGRVRLRLRVQVLGPAQHSGFDHDRFHPGSREGCPASSCA
jgi:tRNA-2-methylthio-N6-dimethylallyladenosine synthase